MSAYVDPARWPHRGSVYCHMTADTLSELLEVGAIVGLGRGSLQDKPGHVHFDVTERKRARLIKTGLVIELDRRTYCKTARRLATTLSRETSP